MTKPRTPDKKQRRQEREGVKTTRAEIAAARAALLETVYQHIKGLVAAQAASPTNAEIAEATGISAKTVQGVLQDLYRSGRLVQETAGNYRMLGISADHWCSPPRERARMNALSNLNRYGFPEPVRDPDAELERLMGGARFEDAPQRRTRPPVFVVAPIPTPSYGVTGEW